MIERNVICKEKDKKKENVKRNNKLFRNRRNVYVNMEKKKYCICKA